MSVGFRQLRRLSCVALFVLAGCSPAQETSAPPPPAATAPPATPAAAPPAVSAPAPAASATPSGSPAAKGSGDMHAIVETSKGAIELEFLPADAPKGVENFRLLGQRGYYNGLTLHRIVKGFMLQGGDPNGNGTGGESAWGGEFADEINPASPLYRSGYKRGIVAYANRGANTNGSQFFIMHNDYPLPPNYVIFAKVTAGFDVIDAIANTPTTMGDDGNMSRPLTPVIIKKVTIKP